MKGGKIMKNLLILTAFITLIFTGCATQKTTSTAYDDVYNTSPTEKLSNKSKSQLANEDLSTSQSVAPDSKTATWSDLYDQNNSSGKQDTSSRKTYYDEYNNSLQQGDQGNDDVNVYIGSSWSPYFWGPAISIGYGWGYPYYSYYDWGYPYWYYPYYSYGYYGWGGYWNGYWDGYYDGSWGYYPYSTAYYYGPRKMMSSSGNYGYYNRRDGNSNQTVNNRSYRETTPRRDNRSGGGSYTSGTRNERTTPVVNERTARTNTTDINRNTTPRYSYDRTKVVSSSNTRGTSAYQGNARTRTDVYTRSQTNNGRTVQAQPSPRYVRPEQARVTQRSETQNYSSPAYRQPKSSQEYISPANNRGSSAISDQRRNSPSPSTRSTSPSGNSRFSSPSNSNVRDYSSPSSGHRSSSSPSSSPSYSSPSRSGGSSSPSYSSPSRSSGGGGNSGSSGGGGRRR